MSQAKVKAAKPKSRNRSSTTLRPTQHRLKQICRKIDVTQFTAYRDFLKALYEQLKTAHKSYSYVRFAEDLGLSASNGVWQVMQARRDLSKSSAIKIAETLAMPAEAKKYFLLLVNHNNAREADQREQLMQDIVFCKSQYFTKQDEDGKALEYFQEWYHPVIREMTALDDFQSDPEWINVRLFLKLLPRQIEKSLELLERLGLIRFDAVRQRFVSTGEQVMPSRAVARLAHIRFHQKACDNARESMTVVPANRRDMNVMTLSITEDMAEQIKKIFLAACEQAMRLESSATQKTEVYQVNVQMFALTRLSHEQKDEA